MAIYSFPGGIGGSSGDSLVTAAELMATKVVFVDSVTGSDANDGLSRAKPKATLAGAYAIAANGTTIVLFATHSEAVSSVVTVSVNRVTIVGEGSSGGQPTATLTQGNNVVIQASGIGCQIRNVKFAEASTASVSSKVIFSGARGSTVGCRFECGPNTSVGLELTTDADHFTDRGSTFISTSTSSSQPARGMLLGTAPTGVELYNTVFDAGTKNFSAGALTYSAVSPVDLFAEGISLLRGATMEIGTSVYGVVNAATVTGGGRIF
jgi:hypothetical protein